VQVVCNYLQALDNHTLPTKDIQITPFHPSKTIPHKICVQLLERYFVNGYQQISFTALNSFLLFFSHQLAHFAMSQFFTVASIKAMVGQADATGGIRETLINSLLRASTTFAIRSAGAASNAQVCSFSHSDS
jgi:hypothetical protein